MDFTIEQLKALDVLEGLSDSTLEWLAQHGARLELSTGSRMVSRGQSADYMFIVVSGAIQRYEEIGGQWLVVATTSRGQVTGMLPFSRMTEYPGHAVASEPSQVLRVAKDDFEGMLATSHELGERLVAEMSNRVRGDVRLEQQRDKMMALGRLSAGLAHELNNPAAAIRRTAANLAEAMASHQSALLGVVRSGMEARALDAMESFSRVFEERARPTLAPLDRSEREDEMAGWLEDHGVPDPWELAAVLTDAGMAVSDLEVLAEGAGTGFADAVGWAVGSFEARRMVDEITSAAGRISELVGSVKTYSHMDRSSEHKPTDVREGLDNTLTMFGHRLKEKGISLTRAYADDVPAIPGHAGELNQVWTNLIDNAIDAMGDGGALSIEVDHEAFGVTVRIVDDGPGIPDDIVQRVFDPFFTTKDVGHGTGLGLDIARRIVQTHRGQIQIQSRPGRTEVRVRLPVQAGVAIG